MSSLPEFRSKQQVHFKIVWNTNNRMRKLSRDGINIAFAFNHLVVSLQGSIESQTGYQSWLFHLEHAKGFLVAGLPLGTSGDVDFQEAFSHCFGIVVATWMHNWRVPQSYDYLKYLHAHTQFLESVCVLFLDACHADVLKIFKWKTLILYVKLGTSSVELMWNIGPHFKGVGKLTKSNWALVSIFLWELTRRKLWRSNAIIGHYGT